MQQQLSLVDKWHLILGKRVEPDLPLTDDIQISNQEDQDSESSNHAGCSLQDLDNCLDYVYSNDQQMNFGKQAGANSSNIVNWLDLSKQVFPPKIFEIIQKDAIKYGKINEILQSEEHVKKLELEPNLLYTILANKDRLNKKSAENAKILVDKIVSKISNKFATVLQRSLNGKRNYDQPAIRTFRNLDIKRVIRANLKYYQQGNEQEQGYIIPERLYFNNNVSYQPKHYLYIVQDQSGSMLSSFVNSAILAAIFAKLPSMETNFICYDTRLVDYSSKLDSIVELLFSAQLGGGTNGSIALSYVEKHLVEPHRSICVLITDLYDINNDSLLRHIQNLLQQRVKVLVLPSLELDLSVESYDKEMAQKVANLGALVLKVTPFSLIDNIAQISRNLR